MAPPKRNNNASGLGRAIINKQVKDLRERHESGLYTTDVDNSSRLKSVTQERDLDEFLSTATLAGLEFTAERRNVKIVSTPSVPSHNPHLLSEEDERSALQKQSENRQRLRVPRRPGWKRGLTPVQLDRQEKDAFLDWRRGLAELQDRDKFLLTPFERNIEVWRQLWRVLERSHLIVQIVDARNPLNFRCEDLESYILDVEGPEGEEGTGSVLRRNLLLINKSDLLTARQRRLWADYFDRQNVTYAFFSAANAGALQELRREMELAKMRETEKEATGNEESSGSDDEDLQALEDEMPVPPENGQTFSLPVEEDSEDAHDPRTRVLSVLELEDLFFRVAPDLTTFKGTAGNHPTKPVVGLVGYPNVGKSSTINALIGEKKVSVSSTPGKTKHFQTINLSSDITLCDCPGLVFPQFATTKASMVCDGILPIDQMREYTGPITLVIKRIMKEVLEATYGLDIQVKGVEDGGDGVLRAEDLLSTYAVARGFTRAGQGTPDEARAARYILKDYVNAKLLYCHPPPDVDPVDFNEETRAVSLARVAGKKRAPITRVGKDSVTFIPSNSAPATTKDGSTPSNPMITSNSKGSRRVNALDHEFFESNAFGGDSRPFIQNGGDQNGTAFPRVKMFPHQFGVGDDGRPLSAAEVTARMQAMQTPGKKHHKAKRTKQRSGKGFD
ncbi:P-loop containing nucleoside triphosphate hydrolase protein [Thelephora ganbajun]|uniref:P-loop containing nucleoside triphosphate hydrolase protein n=1 Tax=Thelephora ganbajun TaxID=370292 RepID=A0ACB6ZN38_THEGA|nr:P-loop containing nucleoside triphosphate hydrolase protein [Thelephora ganbajun]